MTEPENMHGIHSQPVTPHHHFAPVNSTQPANAPAEARAEGMPLPQDHDYTLLIGAFVVVIAVFVGLLFSNYLSQTGYAENPPAPVIRS